MTTNLPTMHQDDNAKEGRADNILETIFASFLPTMYQYDNVKEWCAVDIAEAILATLPGIETAYDLG